MVTQFSLPRSIREQTKRRDVQQVGVVHELSEYAPKLALSLAKTLFGAGEDLRNVYKQTGWFQGPNGEWLYNYADQSMKIREDNKLLMRPGEQNYVNMTGEKAAMYEQPGIPMKGDQGGYTTQKEAYIYQPGQEPELAEFTPFNRARYGDPNASSLQRIEPGQPIGPNVVDKPPGELPFSMQDRGPEAEASKGTIDFSSIEPSFADFTYGLTRPNRPRNPTFNELFSHPNQEALAPQLGGIPVEAKYSFSGGSQPNASGQFNMQDQWDVQPYKPWQPGQVEGSSAAFQGGIGGVGTLWSMPSVALHEVIGHGGQQLGSLPRGGMPSTPGMKDFGQNFQQQAQQTLQEMTNYEMREIARLAASGMSRPAAEALFRQMHPEYWSEYAKYQRYAQGKAPQEWPYPVYDPSMLGYLSTQGEAQALNFQKRAAELSNRVPLTDETRMGEDFAKRLEGDVYPMQTYPVPPDLTHGEVTKGFATDASGRRTGVDVENLPLAAPGSFSWLMQKTPPSLDDLARMLLNKAGMP